MAKEIDGIIAEVLVIVEGYEARAAAGRKAVEFLRSCRFGPSDDGPGLPGEPGGFVPGPDGPEDLAGPSRACVTKPPRQRAEYRKIQKNSSGFKGVYRIIKGGKVKYKVSCWDKKKKKHVYLGLYDDEYTAAAAYAEHTGDKKEAALLRAMVKEAAELNPDRPITSNEKSVLKKADEFIWVCKRCGLQYKSSGTCAGCGHDDMRKVPAGQK